MIGFRHFGEVEAISTSSQSTALLHVAEHSATRSRRDSCAAQSERTVERISKDRLAHLYWWCQAGPVSPQARSVFNPVSNQNLHASLIQILLHLI